MWQGVNVHLCTCLFPGVPHSYDLHFLMGVDGVQREKTKSRSIYNQQDLSYVNYWMDLMANFIKYGYNKILC